MRLIPRILATLAVGALASRLASAQTGGPVLTLLNPATTAAGGPAFNITLTGSNFSSNSVAIWNGVIPLATTFTSATQLTAAVPTNLIATAGSASIMVQNLDGLRSSSLPFTITPPPISITTDTLTVAVVGVPYTFTLAAINGTPPYTWAIIIGSLPSGLSLNPTTGTISGTPLTAGPVSFSVRVNDVFQTSAQKTLQLTVNPPPFAIGNTSPLPAATVGASYTLLFFPTGGGVQPFRWSTVAPPPGLTLDPVSGILNGTPTSNGTFTFTVQVADSSGLSASKVFTLVVNPAPLVVTTDAVFSGTAGLAYSQTFGATGGIPPYRWTLLSGTLGAGLSFDTGTATITGTPQATGSFPFTVQVTDSAGVRTSKAFTLTVDPPRLNILTASPLPNGVAGSQYTQRFSAIGGAAPYTWSITAGSVPGLTLDPLSGDLSGLPVTTGAFNFTVTVRDSTALTSSKSFALTINPSALTLTTPRDLTAGSVGIALAQTIVATGGVPPYAWSANGLPSGLALDPVTGVLSGVPVVPGSFSFTVRVTDAARTTALDLFRIVIGATNLPTFVLSGLAATVDPAAQPQIQLSLTAPYPVDLAGQLVLSFLPDSGSGDATIQFSTGGRTVAFTIPANSTTASFPVPVLALQTGTVAGSIRIAVQVQVSDIDVTPNPAPSFTARLERAAPTISRITVTRSSSGLTVQVIGFSTAREVTQAVFQFSASTGTLQTPQVTVPVENLFSTWFQDPASSRIGSQFMFSQQFNVQGDSNVLTLQSVTLTNRVGSVSAKP